MRNGIKGKLKSEDGASQVVEMTLVFPIVLMVMAFLIYLGSYVMQSIVIYNDAQRVAVAAAREAGLPGYSQLYQGTGVTTKADFNWPVGMEPARKLVNAMMEQHEPYRYVGNGFLNQSEKNTLETNLENLIGNSSFLAASSVDCTITTANNLLSQQVQVHVIKHISTPSFLKYFGIMDDISIDLTATAIVGDPAEFVRNTDMVFDMVDYVFKNLKIGGSTLSEKISKYKQKFGDVAAKLELGW